MSLEQRDKELAAIGASIGSNCEPCITHHLAAGRDAGLSQTELEAAVASAHAVRREAVELLAARIHELLGHGGGGAKPAATAQTSKAHELVALGVSVSANSHPLLHVHVGVALDVGLEVHEVKSALKMAGYVQQHAAALTADAVTRAGARRRFGRRGCGQLTRVEGVAWIPHRQFCLLTCGTPTDTWEGMVDRDDDLDGALLGRRHRRRCVARTRWLVQLVTGGAWGDAARDSGPPVRGR